MQSHFSFLILFVLLTIFIASCVMFWQLERRWTARRQWVSFAQWGRSKGFRFRGSSDVAPIALLASTGAAIQIALENETTSTLILQVNTSLSQKWNLLVRTGVAGWPDTALRPAHQQLTIVDLMSMQSFPLLGPTDRFVIYGADSAAARKLSQTSARALLPPDIGLILKGDALILDFTSRPFDTIEFDRMIALADQIAGHLLSR